MSSSEPIRPIGPVAGGVYVSGTQYVERVTRRRPREEQEREGHHHHHDEPADPHEEAHVHTWIGPSTTPAGEAGAYDDHGRSAHEVDDPLPHRHIDATA